VGPRGIALGWIGEVVPWSLGLATTPDFDSPTTNIDVTQVTFELTQVSSLAMCLLDATRGG